MEVRSVLVRESNVVPSKWFLEDGQGFKAGNGGKRQKYSWRARRGEKKKPGDRPQVRMEPVAPTGTPSRKKSMQILEAAPSMLIHSRLMSHGQAHLSWRDLVLGFSIACFKLEWMGQVHFILPFSLPMYFMQA